MEPPHIPLLEAWATVEEGFGEGRVAAKLRARVEEIEARRRGSGSESSPVEIKGKEMVPAKATTDDQIGQVMSVARRGGNEVVVEQSPIMAGYMENRSALEVGKDAERTRTVDSLIKSLLGAMQ